MKMRKMFLAALVGLGMFTGCNNDEVPAVNNDGTMSMYLKFEGLSTGTFTKAIDVAKAAGAISFDNITVYFANASGVIQKTETLNSSAQDWNVIGTTGHIFHQIPNSVNQVYVVGNAEGKDLPAVTVNTTNISAVKAQALQVADEQDFEDVILFGEDTQIEPAEATLTDPEEGHNNLYKAEVTLVPFVSRFEVKGIQCEDLTNSKYKKIVLQAIGLMDYNNKFTLGGTASEEMTITNVLEPGSTAESGKYIFGETTDGVNGVYTNYSWAWDKITGTDVTLDANDEIYNPDGDKYFVYHFCPKQITGNKNVQIKLAVDAYTDDTTLDPMGAVVTASFNTEDGIPLTQFEAGKIYRIDSYKFKVENVKPWNPDELICVNVVVTVANWNVIALTPVFE